jgi:hypothetical protein
MERWSGTKEQQAGVLKRIALCPEELPPHPAVRSRT